MTGLCSGHLLIRTALDSKCLSLDSTEKRITGFTGVFTELLIHTHRQNMAELNAHFTAYGIGIFFRAFFAWRYGRSVVNMGKG